MSGTATSQTIFFIVSIIAAGSASITIAHWVSDYSSSVHADFVNAADKYRSSITIINDPLSTSDTIYVKNTGKGALNADLVNLFVDGILTNTSGHSVIGGTAWVEGSVLCINTTLPVGEHSLRVVLKDGLYDAMNYKKGE